ncbi:polymorphic toxin-type HINT domain-containing protein [Gimesia maris]|uniref:Intein C-terminal splicing domain-containing protein n=1 Tax=Gimesia maris TaxID=122 RepID=A0ABX5YKA6_9PLAN|nr:polymorphic toxin-type HINT domain-containing protein [Gimesia maris]EDL57458.1 hypothetical protein PM8797T_02134 [Gimesia maris DSM 8797]QEG16134.1 hypothetical protein GmarT_19950 [Gimesia maris]
MTNLFCKLLTFCCLLFTGFCFLKAGAGLVSDNSDLSLTEVEAAVPARITQQRLQTTPIQQMRPGMRVLGRNPDRWDTQSVVEPDLESWRLVSVRMEQQQPGQFVLGQLLRPLSWIRQNDALPGAVIQLEIPEMHVAGDAEVLSIADCPPIRRGPGSVVTGTFQHVSDEVISVFVEGEPEPIGTTSQHPFWSRDRNAFVPAGELRIGEELKTALGTSTRVTSIEIRAGPETVYGLEVAGEHVYSVTGSGLLVHNSGPCNLTARGYYDSGYIGIVNGSADEFSDTLHATFGTYDVLPISRLVSQADTVGGVGLSASTRTQGVFRTRVEFDTSSLTGGTGFRYEVFQRSDIDWSMIRTTGARKGRGLTNAEAAARHGIGPIFPDGSGVVNRNYKHESAR